MFRINFMPLWRIIAVEFKHYDIKISVSAACHSGMAFGASQLLVLR